MKEYVLTEKDIEYLEKALCSPRAYRDTLPKETIMDYEKICTCNAGYFCEHRLDWLLDFIENKELKARKTKLKNLNEN